jgi:hypothetical protein
MVRLLKIDFNCNHENNVYDQIKFLRVLFKILVYSLVWDTPRKNIEFWNKGRSIKKDQY